MRPKPHEPTGADAATRQRPSCLAPVSSCSATSAATPGGTSAGADKKVPSIWAVPHCTAQPSRL